MTDRRADLRVRSLGECFVISLDALWVDSQPCCCAAMDGVANQPRMTPRDDAQRSSLA